MAYSLENTKFFLEFEIGVDTGNYDRREISEPIGWDACEFNLVQDTGRYGRDVSFVDNSIEFSPKVFVRGLTHQWDRLISTYNSRGYEANVRFVLEIENVVYVLGKLDFETAETDGFEYFKCVIIQDTLQSILKKRGDVKIDLLSTIDVDGAEITPVTQTPILTKALPLLQSSTWELPEQREVSAGTPPVFFNPAVQILTSNIENTYSPWSGFIQTNLPDSELLEDFRIIEAANNITNGTLNITGAWTDNGIIAMDLRIRKGISIAESTTIYDENMLLTDPDFELTLENIQLNRGENLYLYFASETITAGSTIFTALNVSFDVISTSIPSVTNGIRLLDAVKQVVKSISGANIDSPILEDGGELYNQFIFKGFGLRQFEDVPFELSFKDLLDWMPECNLDYEIQPDGTVYIDRYETFYKDVECGSFEMQPNDSYNETFYDRYTVNRFKFGYSKYEKGENEPQGNALLGVHTEQEWITRNKGVENALEVSVAFIRDAYLIEKTRKESIVVTENSPTLNDNDTFIIDCLAGTEEQSETLPLNHSPQGGLLLDLFNNGDFNFKLLGLIVTSPVLITGENAGTYQVTAIEETKLSLSRNSSPDPSFSGVTLTGITWNPQVNFKMRTDEGIGVIQNVNTGAFVDGFANLIFNPRRNLLRYYARQIQTFVRYYPNTTIRNTLCVNNSPIFVSFTEPIGSGAYSGTQFADILTATLPPALVRPTKVMVTVPATFSQFWDMVEAIQEDRGWVKIKTHTGEKKIFLTSSSYNWKEFLLTLEGEEKNE